AAIIAATARGRTTARCWRRTCPCPSCAPIARSTSAWPDRPPKTGSRTVSGINTSTQASATMMADSLRRTQQRQEHASTLHWRSSGRGLYPKHFHKHMDVVALGIGRSEEEGQCAALREFAQPVQFLRVRGQFAAVGGGEG